MRLKFWLAFDLDSDGSLSETELKLDNSEKQAVIAGRLSGLGLENPRIEGEIQPYSINHNIARGEWAISDCKACHNDESEVAQPILLASHIPGGVQPEFVQDNNTTSDGEVYTIGWRHCTTSQFPKATSCMYSGTAGCPG